MHKIFSKVDQIKIGKANILKDGKDILILGIGPIINEALIAAEKLESNFQRNIAIADFSSIKPMDEVFLKKMLHRGFKTWITLEEHGFLGGLGIRINNWLFKNDESKMVKTINLNTPDKFIHNLGKQQFLREELNIDRDFIYKKLLSL